MRTRSETRRCRTHKSSWLFIRRDVTYINDDRRGSRIDRKFVELDRRQISNMLRELRHIHLEFLEVQGRAGRVPRQSHADFETRHCMRMMFPVFGCLLDYQHPKDLWRDMHSQRYRYHPRHPGATLRTPGRGRDVFQPLRRKTH